VPESSLFHLLWSHSVLSGPRGLVLAREKGWLAAWDDHRWLYLLTGEGKRQGQVNLAESLTTAAIADDGSALAAGSKQGSIWWLNPDLSIRWQKQLPDRILSLAMDPFGQYLAASDAKDHIHLFDQHGESTSQWQCPRPMHHLAFVPMAPCLIASADYGLVAGYDLAGQCLWRDGLVSHVGALATSGDGSLIALACYTDGIQRYRLNGTNLGKLKAGAACRLLAAAFDARTILTSDLGEELLLLDGGGRILGSHKLEKPAVALTLAPLGDEAHVVLDDGRLLAFQLRGG
jgi:hypothetical protein